MNFLLTGATGFIGKRLIRALLDQGHFVSMFTRKVEERDDRHVGQFFWDMKGPAPAEPFRDIDVVIHLAGEPVAQRWTDDVKRKIRESRVNGTRNLVEGISRLSKWPPVLISASATGYYGDRGEETLTESSMPGSGFLASICVEWEREADRAETIGLRLVKLRTGVVLGKDGGALAQMLPPFQLGAGGKLASGQQWMSWIHVDDLVALIVFAAENSSVGGPVNGTAPEPVRNSEFTAELASAIHRPAVLTMPAFALKLMYGEMADVLLGGQRVLPAAARAAGFSFRYPALQDALANIFA